ncbi:MAG: hypothetical protein NC485_14875 [Ruminococcus flavefaciens]|nr:hypothetical protein [Ruminococcus flavefaciens]
MYELGIWLTVVSASVILIPNIVVGLDKLCSRLDEFIERRKRRKELLNEYRKWYDKALSCDNFGGAVDKGKAIAQLIIIRHELKKIDKKKPA